MARRRARSCDSNFQLAGPYGLKNLERQSRQLRSGSQQRLSALLHCSCGARAQEVPCRTCASKGVPSTPEKKPASGVRALCGSCDGRDALLGFCQHTLSFAAGLAERRAPLPGVHQVILSKVSASFQTATVRILDARRAFWLAGAPIDLFLPMIQAFVSFRQFGRCGEILWKTLSWADLALDHALLMHDLRLARGKAWRLHADKLAQRIWAVQAGCVLAKIFWQLQRLRSCEEQSRGERSTCKRQALRHLAFFVQLVAWAGVLKVSKAWVGAAGMVTSGLDICNYLNLLQ
eukprot:TRINITY_DN65703_c0_g1_i1.p1 TRINITY_DN65703_c0_g1~~TRINITY_DN65703_c0_g1_i1.p1  ORF type:complete len:305 (+),score=44.28 TRINITY_DN65703_c0_g1_i1:48-917(+)